MRGEELTTSFLYLLVNANYYFANLCHSNRLENLNDVLFSEGGGVFCIFVAFPPQISIKAARLPIYHSASNLTFL